VDDRNFSPVLFGDNTAIPRQCHERAKSKIREGSPKPEKLRRKGFAKQMSLSLQKKTEEVIDGESEDGTVAKKIIIRLLNRLMMF